jgi:hypothetical protein
MNTGIGAKIVRRLAMEAPTASVDELLRLAIEQKRLVRFVYNGKLRIIEPHDYGIHNGSVKLLAFQVGGASRGPLPNWRWMEANGISHVQLLDHTFPGGRPNAAGKHHRWDQLFVRVESAERDGE